MGRNINKKVSSILRSVRYATVSTVDENGAPWAAPVWYVADNKDNIYWWSPADSQHSKNIALDSNIYITIFDSTAPEGEGIGLYLRAEAYEVDGSDLDLAINLYNKSTKLFKLNRENCTGNAPTRIYKATTSQQWINDGIEQDGFYIDKRVDI